VIKQDASFMPSAKFPTTRAAADHADWLDEHGESR
jgi:hypothetical protein